MREQAALTEADTGPVPVPEIPRRCLSRCPRLRSTASTASAALSPSHPPQHIVRPTPSLCDRPRTMSEDAAEPDTLEERVAYWREQAKDARSSLAEAQDALVELEEMSRGLEAELETELNNAQRARDAATRASESARAEATLWKDRYAAASSEGAAELAAVRRELTRTADEYTAHRTRLRDMEVNNDELEAAERAIAASLSDMEAKYNRSLEQTALLQEEIASKDALLEENQRLKDLISELEEELAVRRVRPFTPDMDTSVADTTSAVSPVQEGGAEAEAEAESNPEGEAQGRGGAGEDAGEPIECASGTILPGQDQGCHYPRYTSRSRRSGATDPVPVSAPTSASASASASTSVSVSAAPSNASTSASSNASPATSPTPPSTSARSPVPLTTPTRSAPHPVRPSQTLSSRPSFSSALPRPTPPPKPTHQASSLSRSTARRSDVPSARRAELPARRKTAGGAGTGAKAGAGLGAGAAAGAGAGGGGGASELTARIHALKQRLHRAQRPVQDRRARSSGIPRPVSRASNSAGSPSTSFSLGSTPTHPHAGQGTPTGTGTGTPSGIPRPRASADRGTALLRFSSGLPRSPSALHGTGSLPGPGGRVQARPTSQLSLHASSDRGGTSGGGSSPPRPPSRSLFAAGRPWSPSIGNGSYSPSSARPFSPCTPATRPFSPTGSALPRLSHTRRHSQALTNWGSVQSALPAPSPADKLAARAALDRARSPGQRPS